AYTRLILNELGTIEPTYYQHGARYLAGSGTDVWGTLPGVSLHTELELLHTHIGLSRREAIAAATTNFAEAFGWKTGRIAPGYAAHVLLLNSNPLDDLANLTDIHQLWLNGALIDRGGLLRQD
ncbi:MAG: amidohydrolase family protein, partial [Lewinella sp.]|nr:amidohydrolase family protein [Lewinella sp.]